MDSLLLNNFSIRDLDPVSITSFKEMVTSRYPDNGYESLSPEEFLIEIGALRQNRENQNINITRGPL